MNCVVKDIYAKFVFAVRNQNSQRYSHSYKCLTLGRYSSLLRQGILVYDSSLEEYRLTQAQILAADSLFLAFSPSGLFFSHFRTADCLFSHFLAARTEKDVRGKNLRLEKQNKQQAANYKLYCFRMARNQGTRCQSWYSITHEDVGKEDREQGCTVYTFLFKIQEHNLGTLLSFINNHAPQIQLESRYHYQVQSSKYRTTSTILLTGGKNNLF